MLLGSTFTRAIFWLLATVFLLIAGYLFLSACGTRFPFLNFCASSEISDTERLQDENERLASLRDDLLGRLNQARQCEIEPEQASLPDEPPVDDPVEEPPIDEETLAQCQAPPSDDVLVLVDGSLSMGWDYDMDPTLSRRIDQLYAFLGGAGGFLQILALRQELEMLEARADDPSKIDRIDAARDALRPLIGNLNDSTRLRLLSFAQCGRGIRDEGAYTTQTEDQYRRAVDGIMIRPETALAEAIDQLPRFTQAGREADRPVNIVIMSDGVDSCNGDPCAAAARLKAELPYANVSVVSLATAASSNSCIAEATGGRFLEAYEMDQLQLEVRRSLGRLSRDECVALGGSQGADEANSTEDN